MSEPLARLCEQIGEAVLLVPEELLLLLKPSENLMELMHYPLFEVQRVAYKLSRHIVSEQVQSTSLRLEMSPDDGGGKKILRFPFFILLDDDTEKLPEYLLTKLNLAQLDSPNGLFGYLLNWMLMLDHFDNAVSW